MSWFALLTLAVGSWLLYRLLSGRRGAGKRAERQRDTSTAMVECAHCGVYAEEKTGLYRGGQWFCSRQHMQEHLK